MLKSSIIVVLNTCLDYECCDDARESSIVAPNFAHAKHWLCELRVMARCGIVRIHHS